MSYLVSSLNLRRQFESITEANDFRKQLGLGAAIYEIDAFGNAVKLSDEEILKKTNLETEETHLRTESEKISGMLKPKSSTASAVTETSLQQSAQEGVEQLGVEQKQQAEAYEKKGEGKAGRFFRYALIAMMIGVVAIIFIFMILPMLKEFMQTFEMV